MTEKRYCVRAGYWHEYTGIGRNEDENLTTNEACDIINEQDETIQEKQHTINEMAKAIRIYDDGYIGLNKENQRLLKANMKLTEENTNILNLIRTTYQNERTNIGRMVLKQLLDNIEQL